jgi:uncharacterized RDD family membrane protein YckC
MPTTSMRCPKCGFTQMASSTCKSCGAAIPVSPPHAKPAASIDHPENRPSNGQTHNGDTAGSEEIPRAAQEASPVKSQSLCSQCGNPFPGEELIHYGDLLICAACKPVFFQKLKEGAPLPSSMEYAGFWIRFGAKIIDWIVLYAINMAISFGGFFVAGPTASPAGRPAVFPATLIFVLLVQTVADVAYVTYFVGKFRATLGKMAVGIIIVTPDGGRVGYGRAFGRYFAEILSAILCIGYIMAAFNDEKRALHDRICGTRVIKKPGK